MLLGIAWALTQQQNAMPQRSRSVKSHTDSTPRRNTTRKPPAGINPEKDCGCCLERREKTIQMRKDIKWAKDTIAIHGDKEGMKRITAKSDLLAKIMQRLYEKQGDRLTPVSPAP